MAWIQSHQHLGRHPDTRRLAARAGIGAPQVIGHLHYLWWWTLEYAPDGDLSRFSPVEIAFASEWTGDPAFWFAALKEIGWIDDQGRVRDWDDIAGRLARERARDRERKRTEREAIHRGTPPAGNPEPVPAETPDTSPPAGPTDVRRTSAGNPSLDKTTQDKKREVERENRAVLETSRLEDDPPPAGFPRTEADVVATAGEQEIGDFALKLWHLAASRGWCDAKGIRIRSWRSYLAASLAFAKEAEARRSSERRVEPGRKPCRRFREIEEVIHAPLIRA